MKKKSKEKSLLFSQSKKIELLKNIYINIKCLKTKEVNNVNKNYMKEKLLKKGIYNNNNKTNKNSVKSFISKVNKENKEKEGKINFKNIKNNCDKQKTKVKKRFYSYNNSRKKYNSFYKKRNIKKEKETNKSISHTQSTINNLILNPKNNNINKAQNKKIKNRNNNLKYDSININETKIYQNNPLELTFGSSSFKSNIQTETKEPEKYNNKSKSKNKNKSFLKSINTKKNKFEKKDLIRHNKITKLKKKLFFDPNWKIKQKNNKNNINKNKNEKSQIIIHNYKTKNKYKFINNHYTNININFPEKNYHSMNISNERRKPNKKIKMKNNKELIYKNNTFKNKILKNKSYTTKNSEIIQKNTLKRIKSSNNNNNKEYIIKININDKVNGKYKLIIERTKNYIKRKPKSSPKLFLAHPSLQNLFY